MSNSGRYSVYAEQAVFGRRDARVDRPERRDGGGRKDRSDRRVGDPRVGHVCPGDELGQVRGVARGDLAFELEVAEPVGDDQHDRLDALGQRLGQDAGVERRQLERLRPRAPATARPSVRCLPGLDRRSQA